MSSRGCNTPTFVLFLITALCLLLPHTGACQENSQSANLGIFDATADWGLEP